jgi:TP901 family phage tail tape measure protein
MDRDLRIRMLLEAADRVTRPLRDIARGSTQANQELRATRDRLKDLQRAQADTAEFRQLKQGLRSTDQELRTAQERVDQLARHMRETANPTREMTREFNRARQEAQRLTRQTENEGQELQRLRDRLRTAGIETRDLGRHERELREQTDRTNDELREQERRLQTVADRTRRMGAAREAFGRTQSMGAATAATGVAAIGTGLAVARPVEGSVEQAQAFESNMTDIAQKANLSRVAAAGMGRELLAAAKAANQMPEEIQKGVDTLSGFGLDPRQAAQMMRPIGRAATAYKAEIADLASAGFAAHDNLKVPIADTGRMIDAMAQAGKSGAFEVKDMAQYFPSLTAAYQGLGQSGVNAGADLAAAAQITRKGAGDSATAATNLANVLQKISSPATIRAFAKFGVDLPKALQQAYKEGKTPIEAIAELTNKTLKGNLGKIGFLFEDAQVQQGLRPLIQNMAEYRQIRADAIAAANKNTTTDTDFAERLKDSAEQSKRLQVNAAGLGVTFGNMLLPTVNAVLTKINAFASWVGNAAAKNPWLAKAIMLTVAAIAALLIIFGAIAIAFAAFLGPIAVINAGLVAMGVAGGLASIGLLPIIGTILAVVAVVAALAGIAYLIITNWSSIVGFFTGLWATVTAAFASAMNAIGTILMALNPLGMMQLAFGAMLMFLRSDVPTRLMEAGRWMIQGLINGITGMLANLKSTILNAASSAANWFKQKLGIHSPSRVFAGFGGFMMQGLANGIAGGQSEPVQRIEALSRHLTRALAVGAAVPSLTGATTAIASSGKGAPAETGVASGAPITINIYAAPGQNAQDIAQAVRDELAKANREAAASRRSTFDDTPDWDFR